MLSVVIPVFNRPRQLLLAIDSVVKQRGLDATELEIIVVDDNSTPPVNLRELTGWDFGGGPVQLLKLAKNSGPAAARNAGILSASGELIAFLDSDDLWLPEKLARQVALLEQVTAAQPETLHAVTCGFYYKGGFSERLHGRVPIPASSLSEFAGGCWFSPGSTLLLQRDSFLRVGLFDERLRSLEDFDWFIRFGRLGGHLHVVPHLDVIVFRQHQQRRHETIKTACDLIARKVEAGGSIPIGRNEQQSVKAYLNLELAVTNFRMGKPLAALAPAIQSVAAHIRLQASVRKYWLRSKNIPREIEHAYGLLARAALAKPGWYDILVVVYSLSLGGTEKHLSLVLPALLKRGYSIKVYNISGVEDVQVSDVLAGEGVEIISPTLPRDQYLRGAPWITVLRGMFGLMQTYYLEKPQLVHFFLPRAYIIGASLAWAARQPRLVMSRRSLNVYQKKHGVLFLVERLLHGAMTAIVGNSQKVVEQLRDEQRSPNRLVLIYNGIAMEPFERPLDKKCKRSQLGIAEDRLVLITVANLIAYKGHDELVTAVASIKSELPQNWVLLIAGRDDGIGSSLKEKARNLGIAENVRFLDQRSDVAELLRIADIALLCSHEEGFSNALLEAMAAGLPTIATDVGGNAEAVVDGVTGLLVPAKDPSAIARAILRLAHDPAMRAEMGMAGHARVRQNFSLEKCVDGYEALYCSIMDNEFLERHKDQKARFFSPRHSAGVSPDASTPS